MTALTHALVPREASHRLLSGHYDHDPFKQDSGPSVTKCPCDVVFVNAAEIEVPTGLNVEVVCGDRLNIPATVNRVWSG